MLLRIEAPHYVAAALFEYDRTSGLWYCTGGAPILHWMKNKSYTTVRAWLMTKGYFAEWLD